MRIAALVIVLVAAALVPQACATSSEKKNEPPPQTQPFAAACSVVPGELQRGTCGEGMVCAPLPNGMCTRVCGAGGATCAEGSVCVDGPTLGELCAKSCASDVDCRADEGYTCDAAWNACVPAGSASPQLGECAAPPPKKKRFAKVVQLTDETDLGAWQADAAAGVATSGDVVALYASKGRAGEPSNVGAATLPKGGAPVDAALKSEKAQARDPWIAVDATGKVHAVWLDGDGGLGPSQGARVAYATTTDGATWSPITAVHEDADCPATEIGCLDAPMIAIGPSRDDPKVEAIYVAYVAVKKGELRLRRSVDGGATWGAATSAGPPGPGDMKVAGDGEVHVVTLTTKEGADPMGDPAIAVEHRRSSDGGATFTVAARVNAVDEAVPYWFAAPQVAVDAKKKLVYVAYASGSNDGKWNVKLATSKDGASWTSIQVNDDVACANHRAPALALDPKSGRPHVLWMENRTDQGGVAYARCDAGGKKCGANESVHDAPFLYNFARGATRELGRRPWLVVDPKAKKLHALWTQPVEKEGAPPVARVFYASGKLE